MDLKTTTYKNGLVGLRAVDVDSTHADPSGEPAADAIYGYEVRGELKKVNLVDQLLFSPVATDRFATTNPDGQVWAMSYDPLGRLILETYPEKGTTNYSSFNALGEVLRLQDARGSAFGCHFESTYDTAGRPIRLEKVRDLAGGGIVKFYSFDTNLAGWTQKTPTSTQWHRAASSGTGADNCTPNTTWTGGGSLRYGSTGSCTYGTLQSGADDWIKTTETVTIGPEAFVHFMYRRQVRKVSGGPPQSAILRGESCEPAPMCRVLCSP